MTTTNNKVPDPFVFLKLILLILNFKIIINSKKVHKDGRINMKLIADIVPKTVENFR